jgi:ABC-type branched-subunit amino acid transport system ATPase component
MGERRPLILSWLPAEVTKRFGGLVAVNQVSMHINQKAISWV